MSTTFVYKPVKKLVNEYNRNEKNCPQKRSVEREGLNIP